MAVITVTVSFDKAEMDPKFILLHVDISREMNRIATAEIQLLEPETFEKGFQLSDSKFFIPGKEAIISLRKEGKGEKDVPVFKGIVVRKEISANLSECLLTVYMKDVSYQLTTQRKSATFFKKTDDKIITDILENYPKIKGGKLAPAIPIHEEMMQYHCTDWDFIVARAEANGLLVKAQEGVLDLIEPKLTGGVKPPFEYGLSEIRNMEMGSDLQYQYDSIESNGWDVITNKLISEVNATDEKVYPGKTDPGVASGKLGTSALRLQSAVPMEKPELAAWAKAQMVKSRLAMVRGTITVPGRGDIELGDLIELKKVAIAFDGTSMVTGIRHQVSTQGWETTLQIGFSPNWFSAENDLMDPPAAGLLPGINGLQIGIVEAFKKDESPYLRVKVLIPALDMEKKSVWARLATLDAGEKRGFFFRPEVGDEVVIGFFNDDPRQPVILGSLYNKVSEAPSVPDAKNNEKIIVTREGLTINFNDEKKSILIETKTKQSVLISEEKGKESIVLSDEKNGNKVTLDKAGITLKSEKQKILIDAKQDLTLKSGSKIILDAPAVETK